MNKWLCKRLVGSISNFTHHPLPRCQWARNLGCLGRAESWEGAIPVGHTTADWDRIVRSFTGVGCFILILVQFSHHVISAALATCSEKSYHPVMLHCGLVRTDQRPGHLTRKPKDESVDRRPQTMELYHVFTAC